MKQNKKVRRYGIACLTAALVFLLSMPVMAQESSPELLVTKGQNASQVELALTGLGEKAIKGFSLELKLTGGEAALTGGIEAGAALTGEDTRVKILTREGGREATLVVTRDGQLPAGKIEIGSLAVKGKAGEKYKIEASGLEMVHASDYQKETVESLALDSQSDKNLTIDKQEQGGEEAPDTGGSTPENGLEPDGSGTVDSQGEGPQKGLPEGINPVTGVITDPRASAFVTAGLLMILLAGVTAFKRKNISDK